MHTAGWAMVPPPGSVRMVISEEWSGGLDAHLDFDFAWNDQIGLKCALNSMEPNRDLLGENEVQIGLKWESGYMDTWWLDR